MELANFHYKGIYFREIDPDKDLISNKATFGKLFDKVLDKINKNKYFEIIKFQPVLPSYKLTENDKVIEKLLYREQTFQLKQITQLVFFDVKDKSEYNKPPSMCIYEDDIDRYCNSKHEVGSVNLKVNSESQIEYYFNDFSVTLSTHNKGMTLQQFSTKDGVKSPTREYQFIAYNKVSDDFLSIYEFQLKSL